MCGCHTGTVNYWQQHERTKNSKYVVDAETLRSTAVDFRAQNSGEANLEPVTVLNDIYF